MKASIGSLVRLKTDVKVVNGVTNIRLYENDTGMITGIDKNVVEGYDVYHIQFARCNTRVNQCYLSLIQE